MTDDLIEAVARALCCHDENHPEAWGKTNGRERVMWKDNAKVAIRAAAPLILDMVCAHVQENYAFDKRQLVPDIRQLKERFQ